MKLAAYGVASFAGCALFFGGSWRDSLWSMLFGIIVFGINTLAGKLNGLSEISNFVCSLFVAFLATLLDRFVFDGSLCLFGQLLGGTIWYELFATVIIFAVLFYVSIHDESAIEAETFKIVL